MNAVEIAEAVAELVEQPFEPEGFPYSFLAAFDNPPATVERLKSGTTNNSDIGGVLQRNNIHILACDTGRVNDALDKLRKSAATKIQKAKFILATDGVDIEAEDLKSGETLACSYTDLDEKFGFFLPLANITTVREIRESSFDIKATGRLNKLYVELLQHNPEWSNADKRHEMNHFMARLIFCFFAEDTGIFGGEDLLTRTIEQMSSRDASNVHEILSNIFKTMNTNYEQRDKVVLPRWAHVFPYVNGGLFSGSTEVPAFTKIARTYLLHIGRLDWTKINPDVFGSMIQAVANNEERSGLGMHYTSVPNILKVLNPLFLDDLRQQLENAGSNSRKLLNLRNRIKRIRIFDPACGSGNFLVIAYKEMRAIEAEINRKRGESDRRSDIPITNFRGIEIFDFPAEIARLALIIAEYQCDVTYRGQKEALDDFLPLDTKNWITCGNALRLDWLSLCPPTGEAVEFKSNDFFMTATHGVEVDFINEGGETYVCGNPPYKGGTKQSNAQKEDMAAVFSGYTKTWGSLDYISGWFLKFAEYAQHTQAACAFVSTNSICQGEQVARLWPHILSNGLEINFAYTSFKWQNLASKNAGVSVIIIGLAKADSNTKVIYHSEADGKVSKRAVPNINQYLVASRNILVSAQSKPVSQRAEMTIGSKPVDGGNLILSYRELTELVSTEPDAKDFLIPFFGANEITKGINRYCVWVDETSINTAQQITSLAQRFENVKKNRLESKKQLTRDGAEYPYRFQQVRQTGDERIIVVPSLSSATRQYITATIHERGIISNLAFGFLDVDFYNFALVSSRLHMIWILTVCGKLGIGTRYSNTLGWNTFPIPNLTHENQKDLERSACNIILAREEHYPTSIAKLYDPDTMPKNLREAHELNDELLERIYIGRRFKNDTERLEKLFSMYTEMTTTVLPN